MAYLVSNELRSDVAFAHAGSYLVRETQCFAFLKALAAVLVFWADLS